MSYKKDNLSNADKQVLSCYETLGMSVAEIVDSFDGQYDETSIKIVLYTHSPAYRSTVEQVTNGSAELDELVSETKSDVFNKSDYEKSCRVMAELMDRDDKPDVQFKAAKFVTNEVKGRHNIKGVTNIGKLSILVIQQRMEKAARATSNARNNKRTLDIESEVMHVQSKAA